ncbi:hypothetical protein MMC28_011000 [Mycoblastus sanguinarius]|nr:hypothetical protein [Mycoblastus sanguinarius]
MANINVAAGWRPNPEGGQWKGRIFSMGPINQAGVVATMDDGSPHPAHAGLCILISPNDGGGMLLHATDIHETNRNWPKNTVSRAMELYTLNEGDNITFTYMTGRFGGVVVSSLAPEPRPGQ